MASRTALKRLSPVNVTKLPHEYRAQSPEKMRLYFLSTAANVSSFSVSRRKNSRYEICSIESIGLLTPPAYRISINWSTFCRRPDEKKFVPFFVKIGGMIISLG